MPDPVELTQYIRFQLSELGARNGHHEFEQLCFRLARRTITPDLLPGTGPVGAGGDQGRDHETFRGRRGDEDIAIACTIQSDDVESKIRSDARRCCATGEPVDVVVAMVEANVPIGHRHSLQEEMREELGIRLEIFDGQAIATLLADEEHFWIAQRFLGVPAAMAVPSSTSPEWYAAARGRWVDRAHPPSTYGDLDDVTRAARHVVLDDGPIVDLELWLGTLRRSSVADGDHLQRSAFYQLALLSLRGTESLHGLEDELSRYFDKAADLTGTGELEDAEVLLTMVAVAARVGQATIEPQTIDE